VNLVDEPYCRRSIPQVGDHAIEGVDAVEVGGVGLDEVHPVALRSGPEVQLVRDHLGEQGLTEAWQTGEQLVPKDTLVWFDVRDQDRCLGNGKRLHPQRIVDGVEVAKVRAMQRVPHVLRVDPVQNLGGGALRLAVKIEQGVEQNLLLGRSAQAIRVGRRGLGGCAPGAEAPVQHPPDDDGAQVHRDQTLIGHG